MADEQESQAAESAPETVDAPVTEVVEPPAAPAEAPASVRYVVVTGLHVYRPAEKQFDPGDDITPADADDFDDLRAAGVIDEAAA